MTKTRKKRQKPVEQVRPVIDDAFYQTVEDTLRANDISRLEVILNNLHPADLADVIEHLPIDLRSPMVHYLTPNFNHEVLSYLDEAVQEDILERLSMEDLVKAVPHMDSDDAVELLSNLDENQAKQVLAAVPEKQRSILEESLTFEENTAGRMMQRELVAVPHHWTVGQTIDFMRVHRELPMDFFQVFLVDPDFQAVGIVSLSKILRNNRGVALRDLAEDHFMPMPAYLHKDEVAFLFQQYGMMSAPVVNEKGQLLGRITIDDVVNVIDEAAEADIMRLGGVISTGDMHIGSVKTFSRRFIWLFINLFTAMLASYVVSQFDTTIQKIVALAVLMPIVAGMGGNAGTQTMTVAVRGLATKELSTNNAIRIILKEVFVGWLNGMTFAVIIGCFAYIWMQDIRIAGVLAAAMVINLMVAALFGVCIPLILSLIRVDPAIASGVFLTTVTDCIGFLTFLGLATLFLV